MFSWWISGNKLSGLVLACAHDACLSVAYVCACLRSNIFSETFEPNFIWMFEGTDEKPLFEWSRSFLVFYYSAPGFCVEFYCKFAPAVQGLSRGFANWKLNVSAFPQPHTLSFFPRNISYNVRLRPFSMSGWVKILKHFWGLKHNCKKKCFIQSKFSLSPYYHFI